MAARQAIGKCGLAVMAWTMLFGLVGPMAAGWKMAFGLGGLGAAGLETVWERLWLTGVAQAAEGQAAGELAPAKPPVPSKEEIRRAEGIVQEVFGKEIAQAKTPAEKSRLGREIMRLGLEDKDLANQYAALQAARRLAVEALDGALGLEAVRELASRFEPAEKMPAWERLREAERLWKESESATGRTKLGKQLNAAEGWIYTRDACNKKWAERLRDLENTGPFAYIPTAEDKKIAQMLHGKTIILVNKKSGHVMNVRNASKVPTKFNPYEHVVQLATPAGQPSGRWMVTTTKAAYIYLQNCNSKLWLGKYTGSNDPPGHPPVAAQQEEQTKDTLWVLHPIGNNCFFIIHADTGLYLRPWDGVTHSNYGLHLYKPNPNDDSFIWLLRVVP